MPHLSPAIVFDLSFWQALVLSAVAVLFVGIPVLVLFFQRRPQDPRLHEGCGDVPAAIVPAVALWAATLWAARIGLEVLDTPGWLRVALNTGGPTLALLPLLVTGLLLASHPTRPVVLTFGAVCLLTLAFDVWLLRLPAVHGKYTAFYNPGYGTKLLLYAVLWLAAAPLPLLVLAVPMTLVYLIVFVSRVLSGKGD